MKKLLLLSALLIFACSSDDDNSNDSDDSNSIEGGWDFISSTDCGENDESDSCDLESYMTLTNGTGQAYIYDNEDENGDTGPCQFIGIFDISYSVGSSNQNYIFSIQGGEALSAVVDGNTLRLQKHMMQALRIVHNKRGSFPMRLFLYGFCRKRIRN